MKALTEKAMNALMPEYARECGLVPFIRANGNLFRSVEMFGTDECFDVDGFYQYGVVDDRVFKFYYDTRDENGNELDLDCIDYREANWALDVTDAVHRLIEGV